MKTKINKWLGPEWTLYGTKRKWFLFVFTVFMALMIFSSMAWADRAGLPNLLNWIVYLSTIAIGILYWCLYGRWISSPMLPLTVSYLFAMLVSTLVNRCEFYTTPYLVAPVGLVMMQVLGQGKPERKLFVAAFICGSAAFIANFFLVYIDEAISIAIIHGERVGSYFGNLNDVGTYFVWISFFLSYLTLKKGRRWLIVLCLPSFYFLFLTGSLSNILSCLVAVALTLIILLKGKYRWIFIASLVGALSLFIGLLQLPQLSYFSERLIGTLLSLMGNNSGDPSVSSRLDLMMTGLQLFLQRPIFGNGISAVSRASLAGTFSHNNFLELGANYGVFTVLFYESLWIVPLFSYSKLSRREKIEQLPMLMILIFDLFFQITLVTHYHKLGWIILAYVYSYFQDRGNVFVRKTLLFEKQRLLLGINSNFSKGIKRQ